MSEPRPSGGEPAHALPAQLLHDLRTPLGQIIGYAELLVEKAQEAGDAALVPDLRKISAAGYRMLELLDENFQSVRPENPLEPAATGAVPPSGS